MNNIYIDIVKKSLFNKENKIELLKKLVKKLNIDDIDDEIKDILSNFLAKYMKIRFSDLDIKRINKNNIESIKSQYNEFVLTDVTSTISSSPVLKSKILSLTNQSMLLERPSQSHINKSNTSIQPIKYSSLIENSTRHTEIPNFLKPIETTIKKDYNSDFDNTESFNGQESEKKSISSTKVNKPDDTNVDFFNNNVVDGFADINDNTLIDNNEFIEDNLSFEEKLNLLKNSRNMESIPEFKKEEYIKYTPDPVSNKLENNNPESSQQHQSNDCSVYMNVSNTNTNYTVEFDEELVKSIKLVSYSLPSVRYNIINNHNNKLSYTIDGSNIDIELTPGLYTDITDIITYINNNSHNNFKVTENHITKKITLDVYDKKVKFKSTKLLTEILGFSEKRLTGEAHNVWDLQNELFVNLFIENISPEKFAILAYDSNISNNLYEFENPIKLSSLSIKICTKYNNIVDFNEKEHSLLFLLNIVT